MAFLLASPVAEALVHGVLGLARGTALGDAVAFFAYEVPHVLLLLVGVVFVIGVVNTWFTPARVRRPLAGWKIASELPALPVNSGGGLLLTYWVHGTGVGPSSVYFPDAVTFTRRRTQPHRPSDPEGC